MPERDWKSNAPSPVTPGQPPRPGRPARPPRPPRRPRRPGSRRPGAARNRARRPHPPPCRRPSLRSVSSANPLELRVDVLLAVLGDALLRAEDVGRAAQSEQRVVDVGRDRRARSRQRSWTPARSTRSTSSSACGPADQSLVGRGCGAERREQPRAGVVRAGAAETDDDPPRAVVNRGADELAHAVRRTALRVATIRQVQPAGLGRLDVRRVLHHEDCRRSLVAVLVEHRHRQQLAAQRGVQDVDETGTAVAPSATSTSSSSGARRRHPSAIAVAASTAVRVPPNESGAISTRMASSCQPRRPGSFAGCPRSRIRLRRLPILLARETPDGRRRWSR